MRWTVTLALLPLLLYETKDYSNSYSHNEGIADPADPVDSHFMCPTWAQEGLCYSPDKDDNDDIDGTDILSVAEMCAKSCLVYTMQRYMLVDALNGLEYVDVGTDEAVSFGVPQEIDPTDPLALQALQVLKSTTTYMRQHVWVDLDSYMEHIRRDMDCQNHHEDCSWRAAAGHCQDPHYLVEMQLECSPACQTCSMLPLRKRCPPKHPSTDVLKKGELNTMFQKIVAEYHPTILSKPNEKGDKGYRTHTRTRPWILQFDSFLSPEETEQLVALALHSLCYENSTAISDSEDIRDNENNIIQQRVHRQWRTSQTAWCDKACQQKYALVNNIVDRILRVTGLPRTSMERLQFLRYEEGQFYVRHHDHIESQRYLPCGPRILTFFLYLNTVSNGGQTKFDADGTSILVQPRRGRALLWPNVLDSNPTEMDDRTFHEALPVTKGYYKYAANVWFHLNNHDSASKMDCT